MVWLQLMTALVKLGHVETLVLDEPDIYLHSDMQKKLVTICKERSNQVIIATHAVDIIEEVEPDDIISIDKDSDSSNRLSSIDEVQTIVTELGSSQNLKLVHYYRGKTCLFVEGRDFYYLKILAKTLDVPDFVREDGFSVVPLEGFSNWDRLKDINWIFRNAFGEKIKCYVILDNDYHTEEEQKEISKVLSQQGAKVHIWYRKEVENYLLHYDALYRMFTNKFRERYGNVTIPLSAKEFKNKIFSIFEEFKNYVVSQITARAIEPKKRQGIHPSSIISKIYTEFEENWNDQEFRRKVVPGKDFFSKFNTWLNAEYKIRVSVSYAMHSLLKEEIEPEVSEVINGLMRLVAS
jgi:predicted ATP-dependent endonuclease of OLD family